MWDVQVPDTTADLCLEPNFFKSRIPHNYCTVMYHSRGPWYTLCTTTWHKQICLISGDILGLSGQIVYQPITSLAFNLAFCSNLKVIGLNSGHIKQDQCEKVLSLQGPLGTCHNHANYTDFRMPEI